MASTNGPACIADLESLLASRCEDLRRRDEVIAFLEAELDRRDSVIRQLRNELDKFRQVVRPLTQHVLAHGGLLDPHQDDDDDELGRRPGTLNSRPRTKRQAISAEPIHGELRDVVPVAKSTT